MDVGDKIKKFFEKKKAERKFNKAGPGHKLTESGSKQVVSQVPLPTAPRGPPSEEARKAALAALSRAAVSTAPPRKKPLSQASKISTETSESKTEQNLIPEISDSKDPANFAVAGIYFTCPFIGNQVLPKDEWKKLLEEFLYQQLEFEKGLTACLIICTLNKPKEKVESCIKTLSLYLENILKNPEDPKYRKIRIENKVFKERVHKMKGTEEFLNAAGFVKQSIANAEGVDEEFFVYTPEPPETDILEMLIDGLRSAEPILLTLDRNVQVLHPVQALTRMSFPDDFYVMSSEELKREQQLKKTRIESMMELKTKAMRQREEMNERKKYKYAVIRIRFPDSIILQGTFGVYEKLSDIKEFVKNNLEFSSDTFNLCSSTGESLDDDDATLLEQNLVPASILNFRWNNDECMPSTFIKSEVMSLLQPLN